MCFKNRLKTHLSDLVFNLSLLTVTGTTSGTLIWNRKSHMPRLWKQEAGNTWHSIIESMFYYSCSVSTSLFSPFFTHHCVHVKTPGCNLCSLESILRVKCIVYQLFHVSLQFGSSSTPHWAHCVQMHSDLCLWHIYLFIYIFI